MSHLKDTLHRYYKTNQVTLSFYESYGTRKCTVWISKITSFSKSYVK